MKRIISLLLALMLLLSGLPTTGLAAEEPWTEVDLTAPQSGEEPSEELQIQTPASGALIASGSCGEHVNWRLDDAGTLIVSGNGPMTDYSESNQPWRDLADSVINIRIESGVTTVGKRAFYRMDTVQTVTLPETLVRIRPNAFYACVGLQQINLPEGLERIDDGAFHSCRGLKSVGFPASLTYLDYNVFWDCSGLTELTIPSTLTTIRGGAFKNCTGLTKVTIEEGVTSEELSFSGCSGLTEVTLPASMTVIGSSMFSQCTGLQKVNLPEQITRVGGFAFSGCTALTQLELPDTVTEIGQQAFQDCFSLTSFTVPAGVKTIPYKAFFNCTELASVTISGRVTRINKEAFFGCSGLEDVYYGDTQAQWDKIVMEAGNENLTDATIHCAETHSHILTGYQEKAPTCTAYGWEAYEKCVLCDYTTYVQKPATGHSYEIQVVAPTCTEQGYTQHTCHCGDTQKDTYVAALEHAYSITVVPPTYGIWGYTRYACTRCDDTYDTDYVDRLDMPAPQVDVEVDPISGRPTLHWDSLGAGVHFEVYRATKKTGSYTLVGKQITDLDWEDPNATVGKTYYYKVKAVCTEEPGWFSAYSEICLATPICAVPELTVDVNRSTGKPLLTWNKVSGAKKYEIYRVDDQGKSKKLTTTTKLTYTDTKATSGKYYAYYIRALGTKSAYNSDYCEPIVTLCFMSAPTLTLTTNAASGKPSLSWTSVKGAQSYIVCRVLPEGSWDNEEDITVFIPEGRTFVDETAQVGAQYRYAIIAVANSGETSSYFSAEKTVTCVCPRPVVTTDLNDNGKPVLAWKKVDCAEGYKLYRSTKSGSGYKVIQTLDADTLEYVDDSVAAGKTYYYKLSAVGQHVESAPTAYLKLTGKCAIPELSVQAGSTGKPVLTWNKIAGAKKYEIHRSVDGGAFKKLTTTTKLTYTDAKATEGARCEYKVKALGSKSSYHGQFSQPDGCNVICAAPSVTAKIDTASGKASLSWKKITGAQGYEIYRSVNGGDFELVQTLSGTSYLDTAVPADTTCSYYVVTLGKEAVFNSIPSAVKTVAVTLGQTKLKGSVNENGRPSLTWEPVPEAKSYQIYRSTSSSKNYKVIGTATEAVFVDETASGGTAYYYKVTALGAHTEGPLSGSVKLTAKCTAPVIGLAVNKDGKPVLTWDKVSGAKKYEVYRSVDGGAFKKVTTTTKLTYTETKAEVGSTYAYKVRALGSKSSYNSQDSVELSCKATLGTPTVTVKTDPATGYPLVTWTAVPGAQWYLVVREDSGPIATVTGLQYLDRDVEAGKTYQYQVLPEGGEYADSENGEPEEDVPVELLPGQPLLTANNGYRQRGYLSWEYVEGATEYVIYRSTKEASGYAPVGTTTINRYMDMTGVELKSYYYKIAAVVGQTEGMQSNPVKMAGIRAYTPYNTDPNRFVVVGSNWETSLIWWEITSDGVLTIHGTGVMRNGTTYPWTEHKDYFNKVVIADGVTSVAPRAFALDRVTEVTLGKHVSEIGESAFYGSSISTITFPAALQTIERSAFAGCSALETLVFAEDSNLRIIKEYAFSRSGLKSFVAPKGLQTIEQRAFTGCSVESVYLTGDVTTVAPRSFEECRNLKCLVLGEQITELGGNAFEGCTRLERIEYYCNAGSNVAFMNHTNIKTVVVGGKRTRSGIFSGCSALEEVILLADVQLIESFAHCKNLKKITLPETLTEIGNNPFINTGITQLTIPASVKIINIGALANDTLTEVEFLGDYSADFQKNIFGDGVVTVYYPKDNPTWTQEVRDRFVGNLIWIAQ